MWAAVAATLAAVFPAHTPGKPPIAYAGPSGRIAVSDWRYRADPNATGSAKGWQRGNFGGSPIRVPDVANPQGTGPARSAGFRGSVGWYAASIGGKAGLYNLRFDGAASKADVWIDGRRIGSHDGAFDPFEFDTKLSRGRHRLVVRVDWRSPARQSAAGFHRTWFNYGGLNGEVTTRRLTESVVSGAAIETRLEGSDGKGSARAAVVDVEVRVRNRLAARSMNVVGQLKRGSQSFAFATQSRVVGRDRSATLRGTVTVPEPALWKPGEGNLYELDLAVPHESGFRARVGLRTIASSGARMRVNDAVTILRGASMHEDSPANGDALTPAEMDGEVGRLKSIGANAVRTQHPLAAPLLERLDAAGILVWQQIGPVDSPGVWLAKTPRLRSIATERVRRALRAARLHPSIAVWGLGVEVAGNGAPGGQAEWIDANARALKNGDPGRLVGVDVWGPYMPAVPGRLYSHLDTIGITSYFGWYESTFSSATRVAADLRTRVARFARAFPGRLLVLTEFGAEGTPSAQNPSTNRGGRGYQASLLATQLAALRGQPIGGALVWILRDFTINPAFRGGSITKKDPKLRLTPGLNQKGLFDRRGRAKPAAAAVRAGLAALGP